MMEIDGYEYDEEERELEWVSYDRYTTAAWVKWFTVWVSIFIQNEQ